jgi:2-aminoadipate transaminase
MEYKFSDKLANLKPSAIREIFKSLADPEMISFAAGNPSPQSFPVEKLAALSAEIFETDSTNALQYSITEGYIPLRRDVCARLANKFDINAELDETIIVSGGQQAIELACKALCNEGDTVICEDPSFIGGLNAFRSLGANTVGLPLENDGPKVEMLERILDENPRAKMIYLIPTFQNPAGITTSLEKRRAIYEIAARRGIMIFEDNPYGELRFAGEEVLTMKSFDTEGIVIYASTFSKILSSGMRVGYVTAPKEVVSKMVVAKQSEDVHTNIFFQMLCHKFIERYDLDEHIASIRALYRDKCNLMLKTLDEYMPKEVVYTRPEGGLFLWATLPDRVVEKEFVKKAIERKVAVVPGETFNCDVNAISHSFRLNYSTPSDEEIVTGCRVLGETARDMLG